MNAPRRVFAFLTGIDLNNYSRERVCRSTGLSPRTVDRALGNLVEIKAIHRERGGRATSAKIRPLMSLEEFMAHQVRMAHQVAENGAPSLENGALSGALRALEVVLEQEQQPRKPMGVEMPPGLIWSDYYQREVPNPAYIRCRDALRRAAGDIRRAVEPERYRDAVIRRVLRRQA